MNKKSITCIAGCDLIEYDLVFIKPKNSRIVGFLKWILRIKPTVYPVYRVENATETTVDIHRI